MDNVRPVFEHSWVHPRTIRLDDAGPLFGKKIVHDGGTASRGELEHDRLLVRGVITPQVGIAGPTSAVRIDQFGEGFIDLNVATSQDPLDQLRADRDQQMRRRLDIPASGLAPDPYATTRINALLPVQR